MADYNGFSDSVRAKAKRWILAKVQAGLLPRPAECMGCGRTKVWLSYHAEDYNAPFGPHVHKYVFCYPCYMMLRCRFKCRRQWVNYIAGLRLGWNYPEFSLPSWERFKNCFLIGDMPHTEGAKREVLIFDTMGPDRTKLGLDPVNLLRAKESDNSPKPEQIDLL